MDNHNLGGLVPYSINEVTSENYAAVAPKIQAIADFCELDDTAFELLLDGSLLVSTHSKRLELEELRAYIVEKKPEMLAPLATSGEAFIPTLLLDGSICYCAPGYRKDNGIQLFEMYAPYFGVDHVTPNKRYPDDYVIFLSKNANLLVVNPDAFEQTAQRYLSLYRYGLREKTKLTTTMALSYSALMAPTALLRVARWFRFCAGQKVVQGLEPILEDNTQQKIAQFLGISRTTLASAIRVLREQGALDTRYRKIKVNIEKLNDVIENIVKEIPDQDLFY